MESQYQIDGNCSYKTLNIYDNDIDRDTVMVIAYAMVKINSKYHLVNVGDVDKDNICNDEIRIRILSWERMIIMILAIMIIILLRGLIGIIIKVIMIMMMVVIITITMLMKWKGKIIILALIIKNCNHGLENYIW